MKKILMIFTVGIVAMSALSCTSKLENEIAELKQQLNSKLELVIENPNIIPCTSLDYELSPKISVPYSLKGATGKTVVTAICKVRYGNDEDFIVKVVPTDENSGFIKIERDAYIRDLEYIDYSGAEIYVSAVDESGKISVEIIRMPHEEFWIDYPGSETYGDSPALIVPASQTSVKFSIFWTVMGNKRYFSALENFKLPYLFEKHHLVRDKEALIKTYLNKESGEWSKFDYTCETQQTISKPTADDEDYIWTLIASYYVSIGENKTKQERILRLSPEWAENDGGRYNIKSIYIIQKP